jgi:hypothetical protein
MFGADASKLRTLTRRTEFVKCLGALSLGLQAVFIPWFVIRAGMGDPETARFGASASRIPWCSFCSR